MKKTSKVLSLVLAVVMLFSTFAVASFAASKTGLYKVNNKWCYVKNGEVDYSVTGLFKHTNGIWYYVKNGVLDWSKTGLVKHTNGIWYYVKDGRLDWSKTGLVKNTNGIWYYVEDGRLDWSKTGLVKHTNGIWYYVKDGRLDWSKTGLVKHTDGKWYYVEDGRIDFTYTGLCKYGKKFYYVNAGKVDFKYTGSVTHIGEKYDVVNGVVVGKSSSNSTSSIADVVKAINDATAKAAKASYDWTRDAYYTKSMDMGSTTGVLNGIIQGVDENASLDSVIGGFLGIGSKSAKVTNGGSDGSVEGKYLLKATTLTENDVKELVIEGNTYKIKIKDSTNPNANSSLAHATNDYVTCAEVNSSISDAVGDGMMSINEDQSKLAYKNIILKATIDNGQLTNLEYSYTFDINLSMKVSIMTTTGTGAAETKATYSNFKY